MYFILKIKKLTADEGGCCLSLDFKLLQITVVEL